MSISILVVDDEQQSLSTNIEIIQKINEDFQILGAPNGRIACQLARKKKPDLIVMDWQMPEMNGVEALEELKRMPETALIPVIMVTGVTGSTDLEYALNQGAYDYVRKPVDRIELQARVKAALRTVDYQTEILKQGEELKALNALKDKVFSIIAHDLRTPLTSVSMFVDMLSLNTNAFSEMDLREIVSDLHDSVESAKLLLENLLQWSMSQMKGIQLKPEQVNLAELIEREGRILGKGLENKDIGLVQKIPSDCTAYADAESVSFISRNLLSNALKFTPSEGSITISVAVSEEGKRLIHFTDTGKGMSEEQQSKLFHQDTHYSTEGTEGERGTGLGLMLCQEFAQKNGGLITVKSKEGAGSTFTLELPLEA